MRLNHGAVDLSGELKRQPTWPEFVAAVKRVGTPSHVYLRSEQGAAIAFTSKARVIAPGQILTPLCTVWTEDSEEMRGE